MRGVLVVVLFVLVSVSSFALQSVEFESSDSFRVDSFMLPVRSGESVITVLEIEFGGSLHYVSYSDRPVFFDTELSDVSFGPDGYLWVMDVSVSSDTSYESIDIVIDVPFGSVIDGSVIENDTFVVSTRVPNSFTLSGISTHDPEPRTSLTVGDVVIGSNASFTSSYDDDLLVLRFDEESLLTIDGSAIGWDSNGRWIGEGVHRVSAGSVELSLAVNGSFSRETFSHLPVDPEDLLSRPAFDAEPLDSEVSYHIDPLSGRFEILDPEDRSDLIIAYGPAPRTDFEQSPARIGEPVLWRSNNTGRLVIPRNAQLHASNATVYVDGHRVDSEALTRLHELHIEEERFLSLETSRRFLIDVSANEAYRRSADRISEIRSEIPDLDSSILNREGLIVVVSDEPLEYTTPPAQSTEIIEGYETIVTVVTQMPYEDVLIHARLVHSVADTSMIRLSRASDNEQVVFEAEDISGDGLYDTVVWSDSLTDTETYRIRSQRLSDLIPDLSAFDGASLRPEELELSRLESVPLVLERTAHGRIVWDEPLNVTGANLSRYITISHRSISVNVSALDPSFSTPANLTFRNIPYATPIVLRDSQRCEGCEIRSYDDGTLIVWVPGFSNYTVVENTSLRIWSNNDDENFYGANETRYAGEAVAFFAEYLNATSEDPIIGATCEISYSTGPNASMTYNDTLGLHIAHETFPAGNHTYEVTCEANDHQTVTLESSLETTHHLNVAFIEPTPQDGAIIPSSDILVNVSVTSSSNASAFVDFNTSLLGYWSFENHEGTAVSDDSTNDHNATLLNGATIGETGIRGKRLVLDGVNDYARVEHHDSFNIRTEFTVEAWIYRGSQQYSWAQIINRDRDNGFNLQHNTDNSRFEWAVRTDSGRTFILGDPPGGMQEDTWYHLVGVYNGTHIVLYVNGEQVAQGSRTGTVIQSSSPLFIGARSAATGGVDRYFNGSIDEVRFWNRSLSAEEINASYNYNSLNPAFQGSEEAPYRIRACATNVQGMLECTDERTITIDLTDPAIVFTSTTPMTGSITNSSGVLIEVNVTEQNLESVLLEWNATNTTMSCTGTTPSYVCNATVSGIETGTYSYTGWVIDGSGREGQTEERAITIDLIPPTATIIEPANGSSFNETNVINLSYTVSDNVAIDTCGYRINHGTLTLIPNCGNITLPPLINANHTLTLIVNDTAGNVFETHTEYEIDLGPISIIPLVPTDGSYLDQNTTDLTLNVNRPVSECNYTLESEVPQPLGNIDDFTWNASIGPLADGPYSLTYDCTDGSEYENTTIGFTIDTTAPDLIFTSPQNMSYNTSMIEVEYTVSDATPLICSYSLDGSAHVPIGNCDDFTLGPLDDSSYDLMIRVVDAAGNTNETSVTFTIDTMPPIITIVSPERTVYTQSAIDLELSLDAPVEGCTYMIGSILDDLSEDVLTYAGSEELDDGSYTVVFECTDFAGNSAQANESWIIDTIPPVITYEDPTPVDGSYVFNTSVMINVSSFDENEHSVFIDYDGSLLGYWSFENESDLSRYGRTATLRGSSIDRYDPVRGSYARFDGTDQDALIAYHPDFNVETNYSVEAWVRRGTQVNEWASIVNRNGNVGFRLHHNQANTAFEFAVGTSDYVAQAPLGGIEDGVWYHLVGTYDGETIRLYIDGAEAINASASIQTPASTSPVYIGSFNGASRHFNGSIDEVRIWNRTLSAEEIEASYNATKPLFIEYELERGNRSFRACATDIAGFTTCLEESTIQAYPPSPPEFTITNITFTPPQPVEGTEVNVSGTIDFTSPLDLDNVTVRLNVSFINDTTTLIETLEQNLTFIANGTTNVDFEWTARIGTHSFTMSVEHPLASENVSATEELTISAWHVFYGHLSGFGLSLENSAGFLLRDWTSPAYTGIIFYSDVDASFLIENLRPVNGSGWFDLVDTALNLTWFNDSVSALFDTTENGLPDTTEPFEIAGTTYEVPIISSSDASTDFTTGILYDAGPLIEAYDGSQDIVFITRINGTRGGSLGSYEYEIRLPAPLRESSGPTLGVERAVSLG